MANQLTWAGLALLLSGSATSCFSSTGGTCDTDQLPETDPCYMKGCCEAVPIATDGGDGTDSGEPPQVRLCGACNG